MDIFSGRNQLSRHASYVEHGRVEIRSARVSDAPGIGLVHVRSWQAAYRGSFPADYLNGLDPSLRAKRWASYLAGPHDREALLVAADEWEIAGFANIGPSRDEGAGPDQGEVRAIYLMPDRWDQGLGGQLMSSALEELNRAHFSEAILWVLDANRRARRFYERGGWDPDGAKKHDDTLGFRISEVRYRRKLP